MNDVIVNQEGAQKMTILGSFQVLTGVQRGGKGVKKLENFGGVIYGWFLIKLILDASTNQERQ